MEKKKFSYINDEFDLGLVIVLLRKYSLMILALAILGFGLAFVKIRYSMPIYEASATVKVEDKNEMAGMMNYENIYASNIDGEVSRLKSKKLFEKATQYLPLEVSYYTIGKLMDTENYRFSSFQIKHQIKSPNIYQKPISIDFISKSAAVVSYNVNDSVFSKIVLLNQWVSLPEIELKVVVSSSNIERLVASTEAFYFIVNSRSFVLDHNFKALDVKVVNPTAKTISVVFQGNSGQKVADLANSLAERFLDFNVEKKKEGANQMITFTNEQIDKTDARISYYERLLQPYKKFKRTGEDFNDNLVSMEILEKIDLEKASISKKIEELKSFYNLLQKESSEKELYSKILASPDNALIQSVSVNLKRFLSDRREKDFRLKEDSYEFKELDYKIKLEKQDLLKIVAGIIEDQREDIKELGSRRERYAKKDIDADLAFNKDYMNLVRMYDVNKEYYSKLLSKKAEYEMVRAGYVSDNEIIESAFTPNVPISPNKKILYLSFIGGGIVLGILILVIIYLLHNTVTGAKDLEKYTNIPLLGMVPVYEAVMPVSQLLVNKNPKSLMSEAFRSIRSNLQFLKSDKKSKVIAITSTVSGEGKTFVAINLSGIIAFSEKKVVIIDLDLRKPKIHLGFDVKNTTGMSSVLIGKSELDDVIQKSTIGNLDFVTAGAIPPNPSELILSKKMFEVIAELKKRYDVVVFDNPPVGLVTDAFPVMQEADYPVYVLRAGVSKKYFLSNIATLKEKIDIENLSVIINGVEKGSRYDYGGYGGYGYGYGSVYGHSSGYYEEKEVKKKRGLARLLKSKK